MMNFKVISKDKIKVLLSSKQYVIVMDYVVSKNNMHDVAGKVSKATFKKMIEENQIKETVFKFASWGTCHTLTNINYLDLYNKEDISSWRNTDYYTKYIAN